MSQASLILEHGVHTCMPVGPRARGEYRQVAVVGAALVGSTSDKWEPLYLLPIFFSFFNLK